MAFLSRLISILFLIVGTQSVFGAPCVTPKILKSNPKCCTYWIQDQHGGVTQLYQQPGDVFSSESKARQFYKKVKPYMPFRLPHSGNVAKLNGGWYYEGGGYHVALDYSKTNVSSGTDPTYKVRSVAAGRVLSVYWDDWFGNTVLVEHTASNGTKYRSIYLHLRDGFSHDLNRARNISIASDAGQNSNWRKYKRFADKSNPSTIHWGTNSQTIPVSVGQWIKSGQLIGYAGNTGAGGAGNGLKNDGTPKNNTRANNHLHLFMAVKDPNNSNKWVFFDPYGVYNEVGTGCYKLLKNTDFARFFAPFSSSFHGTSMALLSHYFSYYPTMGRGLQTLSVHRKGSKMLVSGSFQKQVNSKWKARFYMSESSYVKWFNTYHQQGYRPRELSVTLNSGGQARFTAIWKRRSGESYYSYHRLTDAQFSERWNTLVKKKKYRVEDHFSYRKGNQRRHAVIFVKDSIKGFYMIHNWKAKDFNQFWKDKNAAGYRSTSLQVEELPWGQRLGGVFMKLSKGRPTYYGMTFSGYQKKFNDLSKKGYRLHKVQGYANSTRWAAIWKK